MNCLFCGHQLSYEPFQTCPGCQTEHEPVPPVSGVNHVSQLLYALQMVEAQEMDADTLAEVTGAFLEKFDKFHQAWNLAEHSLFDQANAAVQSKFGEGLKELDQAIESIIGALELVESAADNPDSLVAAQEQLSIFYKQVCGASALLFQQLDGMTRGSNLMDLPTV